MIGIVRTCAALLPRANGAGKRAKIVAATLRATIILLLPIESIVMFGSRKGSA